MQGQNDIFERIRIYEYLPSLPNCVLKLFEACNSEDTTSDELSKIISLDPALSAKTMQMANSPYMGGVHQTISSLAEAVSYLGQHTIKNLALRTLVLHAFSHSKWNSLIDLPRFWRQSFMCASLAKRIAVERAYPCPDEAYLSGLLHDLGKLVLLANQSKEYAAILDDAMHDSDLLVAEKEKTGATHCAVGAWLIRQWDAESLMADAVLYHHEPLERVLDAFPLVKIVYVSYALCQDEADALSTGSDVAKAVFGFSPSQVGDIVSAANQEVTNVARALDMSIEAPWIQEFALPQKEDDKSKDLLSEVRDVSLLHGTLENLSRADSTDAILQVVERGLQILFDVKRVFFFLCEAEKGLLVGISPKKEDRVVPITGLEIPVGKRQSLIAESLAKRAVLDSFGHLRPVTMTIAEEQIIRLAGTEGIMCFPLVAHKENIGVIVIGISESQLRVLRGQLKLLNMFVNHVAMSLHVDKTRRNKMSMLQSEQLTAAGTIARKVVHEASNSLGIMKNYIKILATRLQENDPALSELKIIGEEIDRVTHIAQQLSDFSEPSKKEHSSIPLEEFFSGLLRILDVSVLQPNKIKTHLSLDSTVPGIVADEDALKQVSINLIKNAAEAMPDGGNIYVRTKRVDASRQLGIEDKAEEPGGLEITVSDDGPGIPDHIKSRLFEPYNTSKGADHSGLGLSIVHSIVKELNGTISCESFEDKGTTFRIILPLT